MPNALGQVAPDLVRHEPSRCDLSEDRVRQWWSDPVSLGLTGTGGTLGLVDKHRAATIKTGMYDVLYSVRNSTQLTWNSPYPSRSPIAS